MNKFALTTVAAMPRASGFAHALEPEVGKERQPERKEGWDGIAKDAGPDWFSQGRIEWISDLFKGDAFGFILRDQQKDEIADYLAHCEAKQGLRPVLEPVSCPTPILAADVPDFLEKAWKYSVAEAFAALEDGECA